ncbi:MAG: hypothetical protein K6T35_09685 [Meiothermus silvanus]|nr:hypothetical protein [Allomeiothermus silvanus]
MVYGPEAWRRVIPITPWDYLHRHIDEIPPVFYDAFILNRPPVVDSDPELGVLLLLEKGRYALASPAAFVPLRPPLPALPRLAAVQAVQGTLDPVALKLLYALG